MKYILFPILWSLPFWSSCHHLLPIWWNSPHQALSGLRPFIKPATGLLPANLKEVTKSSYYSLSLREDGKRFVGYINLIPNNETLEITGFIHQSNAPQTLSSFKGVLETDSDRTWVKLVSLPAKNLLETQHAYSTQLDIETRLAIFKDARGNIYFHPNSPGSHIYDRADNIQKNLTGTWVSQDTKSKWQLSIRPFQDNYLKGFLSYTWNEASCKQNAFVIPALGNNMYWVFTGEDKDCPAHSWEITIKDDKPFHKFKPLSRDTPQLDFFKK